MSTLVKLAIRINILCIIGIVIFTIAVYALDYGAWKIGGVEVLKVLIYLTYTALIISFLQNLIFKPVVSGQAAQTAKHYLNFFMNDEMSDNEINFAKEVIDAKNKHEKRRYIASALIGLVALFAIGPIYGSPAAEYVALAILLLGPSIIAFVLTGSLNRIRVINPEIFDSAMEIYNHAHEAVFYPLRIKN